MQDRRLDQDDHRGLYQGIQDNLPTLNIFKLGFERINTCAKRSQAHASGFLTEKMHAEMNLLLHPMEKLIWHGNSAWKGVIANFGLTHEALDVGTEIAALRNLKHVQNSGSDRQSNVGVVLNRYHLEQCDGNQHRNSSVNLYRVLGLPQYTPIYNTTLTMLEKQQRIYESWIDICPMEIKAFIIDN